jgi:hypothetical protein
MITQKDQLKKCIWFIQTKFDCLIFLLPKIHEQINPHIIIQIELVEVKPQQKMLIPSYSQNAVPYYLIEWSQIEFGQLQIENNL